MASCDLCGEALAGQAAGGGGDLVGGLDLDTQMVEGAGDALAAAVGFSIRTSFSGGSAMAKLA